MARETFFEKKDFSRIPFKETLLAPAHAQGRLNIGKIHFCSGQIAPDGGAICLLVRDVVQRFLYL